MLSLMEAMGNNIPNRVDNVQDPLIDSMGAGDFSPYPCAIQPWLGCSPPVSIAYTYFIR